MADDTQKLERTYSRESRLQRDGLEQEVTPVALVRSVTQERSRRRWTYNMRPASMEGKTQADLTCFRGIAYADTYNLRH